MVRRLTFLKGDIMKMKIAVIALSVLVTGCGVSHDQLRTENRQNLLKLSVGMTK